MLRKGDFGYCDIRYNPLNDHSHGLHALLQQFTMFPCIPHLGSCLAIILG